MSPDDARLYTIQHEIGLKAISPVVAVAALVAKNRSDEKIAHFLQGDPVQISKIAARVRELMDADKHGRKKRNPGDKFEIPGDWKPEPGDIAVAQRMGLSAGAINSEAAKFLNYWTERKEKRPGWAATWRTWVQRYAERNNLVVPPEFAAIGPGVSRDWPAIMRMWTDHGSWSPSNGPKPGEPGCLVPRELLMRKAAG